MIYRFGPFELAPARFQLLRDGRALSLEPKVFDLLCTLARHHDRVVSKRELMEALWPGESVTPAVLPNNIAVLRKALGQARGEQLPVETVHGRGYRLAIPVQVVAASERPPPDPDAFIGRAPILHAGMAVSAQALDATAPGQVVVVCGGGGSGKSRLAEELLRRQASPPTLLRGLCDEGQETPALWPFIQVLRAAAQEVPKLAADWPVSVVELVSGARTVAAAPSDVGRFAVCDAAAECLARLSSARPFAILLEDLHWADAPSWQLLQLLSERLSRVRLLVLATLDESQLPQQQPARARWRRLSRSPFVTRLALEPLTRDDVAAFVADRIRGSVPPVTVDRLHRLTDGNPLLLTEILSESWAAGIPSPARLQLPETSLDRLSRPLGQLPAHLRTALGEAAVLGRDFDLVLLRRISELSAEALLDALDQAQRDHFIEGQALAAGRLRFSSYALREAVYQGLPGGRRIALHRAAAAALTEQVHDADVEGLWQLARHSHRALPLSEPEPVLSTAERAALSAFRAGDYERAAIELGWALDAVDHLPRADPAMRCRLRLRQAVCLRYAGTWGRAVEICEEVLALARQCDLPLAFAAAVLEMAAATRFPATVAPRLFEEARAIVGEGASSLLRRLQAARLVSVPAFAGPSAHRPQGPDDVLVAGDRSAVPAVAAAIAHAELVAATRPDDLDGLLARAASVLSRPLAPAGPEPERVSSHGLTPERLEVDWYGPWSGSFDGELALHLAAHRARIWAYLCRGDLSAADQAFAAFERLTQERRLPVVGFERALYRGGRALSEGRPRRAVRELARLDEWADRHPSTATRHAALSFRASVSMLTGQVPDFSAEQLTSYVERHSEEQLFETVHGAWMAAACGYRSLAARVLHGCVRSLVAGWPVTQHHVCTLTALGDIATRLDERNAAGAVYAHLVRYREQIAVDAFMLPRGPVALYLGRLATVMGEAAAARTHLQKAADLCRALGFGPMLARVEAALRERSGRRAG